MIKVNEKAPDFSLKDRNGNIVNSTDFKDQWMIVYFYPKADTPGCTIEAQDFTAYLEEFKLKNAVILGISNDTEAKLCKFVDKYDLKITLLSDPEHKVIEQFGAWVLKDMYGRAYKGTQRSTFLIKPDGHIAKVWEKVKVNGHAIEVKNLLADMYL